MFVFRLQVFSSHQYITLDGSWWNIIQQSLHSLGKCKAYAFVQFKHLMWQGSDKMHHFYIFLNKCYHIIFRKHLENYCLWEANLILVRWHLYIESGPYIPSSIVIILKKSGFGGIALHLVSPSLYLKQRFVATYSCRNQQCKCYTINIWIMSWPLAEVDTKYHKEKTQTPTGT